MPIYKMDGKKDGKQKYRVRVAYQDVNGNYKQVERTAYGKEEAKELESKLLLDLSNTDKHSITIKALYDEYIVAHQSDVRETSIQKLKENFNAFILPTMGNIKIDKLKTQQLQRWKNHINSLIQSNGQKYSAEYKKSMFSSFSACLNYAVKMEYISTNPLSKLGNFKSDEIKKDMDFYTVDEFKKFIAVARQQAELQEDKTNSINEWYYYVFFMIAFFTGMRKGEIYALKWSDLKTNKFDVKRSISQKLKGNDRETAPKNKSSIRVIQLPTPLLNALDSFKNTLKTQGLYDNNFRICGGEKPIRNSSLDRRNATYSKLAKVKKIRIHDFRHSHASYLVNNNVNIKVISKRLGHSTVEQTWNTYAHLYPDTEEIAITTLNNIEI